MFQSIKFFEAKDERDTFAHVTEIPALKRSIHFKPGLNIIVGPNGSGKSTILDALALTMAAKQSGQSEITQTWLDEVKSKNFGEKRLSTNVSVLHDGQPILYFNPGDTPGMDGGHFDDDFFSLGIKRLTTEPVLSSGQLTMVRIDDLLATMTGALPFPDSVRVHSSVEHLNNHWQQIRDMTQEELLKPNCDPGQPTIVMDEPDRDLDARLQFTFWSIITDPEVTSKFQIIVSSHSHHSLLATFANYIETEPGYISSCHRVANELDTGAFERLKTQYLSQSKETHS